MAPLRNCQIRESLERDPVEPHDRTDERAATFHCRVLGDKPDTKLACRNSRTCSVDASVGTRFRLAQQPQKKDQVQL